MDESDAAKSCNLSITCSISTVYFEEHLFYFNRILIMEENGVDITTKLLSKAA